MKRPGQVRVDRVTAFGRSDAPGRTPDRAFGTRMTDPGQGTQPSKLPCHRSGSERGVYADPDYGGDRFRGLSYAGAVD